MNLVNNLKLHCKIAVSLYSEFFTWRDQLGNVEKCNKSLSFNNMKNGFNMSMMVYFEPEERKKFCKSRTINK